MRSRMDASIFSLDKSIYKDIPIHNQTIFIFSRPLHLNLVMLVFGVLVTLINGALLIRMRIRRNILTAKSFIFTINLTLCDLITGIILICLAILNAIGNDGPWVCLLQGESCLSMCLTMCSYNCSIILQFIAVRYPIYYKTHITRAKIGLIILGCWGFAIAFSCAKFSYALSANHHSEKINAFYFFPYIDLTLKISYVLGNCACFIYVLKIASQQIRLYSEGNKNVSGVYSGDEETEMEEAEQMFDKLSEKRSSFGGRTKKLQHHYQAIITLGIRLLVYIFTSLPLTIFCAYVLIKETHTNSETYKIYWESRDLGVALVLLWFSRAIIDPLITIIREKTMLPRRTSSSLIDESISAASASKSHHCG